MPDNIYEILRNEYPRLVEQLGKNHDICSFLQQVYAHLLVVATDSRDDPKNLSYGVEIVLERLLKIQVFYKSEDLTSSTPRASKIPSQRNMNLVRFLQVNSDVKQLALRVVSRLDTWIEETDYRKEVGFEGIRLENARLWKGLTFTAEIVLKPEFDYAVSNKMGWREA